MGGVANVIFAGLGGCTGAACKIERHINFGNISSLATNIYAVDANSASSSLSHRVLS